MARMVATKTALSIRVDALSDADSKSDAASAAIGIENRTKLESRLRALEHRLGIVSVRSAAAAEGGPKQKKFEMTGNGAGYNDATDNVGLIPTQPQVDEKEERKREKAAKKAKKAEAMDVDGEDDDAEAKRLKKEAKKAKKAAEATGMWKPLLPIVSFLSPG